MYVLDEKTILFILLCAVRYIAFRFHCGQIVVKVPRAEPPSLKNKSDYNNGIILEKGTILWSTLL